MWSFTKYHSKTFLLLVTLCLTGGLLGYFVTRAEEHHHQALITLESSQPIETQFFFDTGKGFNEKESNREVIYRVNVPITIQYDFSGQQIEALRLDPSRSPARIKIHELILQYHEQRPFTVPLDSIAAARDIEIMRHEGRVLILEVVENAKDPILLLRQIGPAPKSSKMRPIVSIIAKALFAFGMVLFIVYCCSSQNIFKFIKNINTTWLMNILYFFSCLLMFYVYAKGKWRDTILFMQNWING